MTTTTHFFRVTRLERQDLEEDPKRLDALLEGVEHDTEGRAFDLERAWHALQFLLGGSAWGRRSPLDFIVQGGLELETDRDGFDLGPVRLLGEGDVATIAEALRPIDRDTLVAAFDGPAMEAAGIYPGAHPGGWTAIDPRSEADFGFYLGAFDELRAYVLDCAARGEALLVWLGH